ncbi:MAG: hypothetical protein ETSY1_44505 [Candidatus Entotheonella factor]|uniref:Uncharacterized protein n=1 Tax=Entotheonella factor TaxID=1429438 RepID=W4L2C7_ENTF1|nr:MAG: hypothetical protein ETSY1_44505 [Candidatus Entotheonella factor]
MRATKGHDVLLVNQATAHSWVTIRDNRVDLPPGVQLAIMHGVRSRHEAAGLSQK